MNEIGVRMREQLISKIKDKYPQDAKWVVGVEKPAQKFMLHRSTASTLMTLSAANVLATYESYNIFQTEPVLVHVTQARTFFRLQASKNAKESDVKKVVFEFFKHLIPPSYKIQYGVRNKKFLDVNYDVSDSILVAIYTWVLYQKEQRVKGRLLEFAKEYYQKQRPTKREDLRRIALEYLTAKKKKEMNITDPDNMKPLEVAQLLLESELLKQQIAKKLESKINRELRALVRERLQLQFQQSAKDEEDEETDETEE